MKKIKALITVLLVLFINIVALAQCDPGGPGIPGDIDGGACPIDTWVIILFAAALILTVLHLHRKQKTIIAL